MNKSSNVYLLCIIAFLQGLVFYGSVATIFRQYRGLSINNIFILETIFVILMFVFEIPWGYIADRIGYKYTLSISFFLFFISKVVFYFAYSFSAFLVESAIAALAISGISGCDSALIYSSVDEEKSDKAFSYYSASSTSGLLVAALSSSLIVRYSLDLTAFFTMIPYGLAFIISLFLTDIDKKVKRKKVSLTDSSRNLRKNKNIFVFVIAMAFISESTHAICVFLNQPIYQRSGIDIKNFGIITAFMQVACLVSARAYKLGDKFGIKKLYIVSIVIIIIANAFLIYLKNWFLIIIAMIIIEGAFALCQPLSNTIQNKSISTSDRATLLSTYAMAGDVIGGFSNLIVGKASDVSLNSSIAVCLVLNILALILVLSFFFKLDKKANYS